MVKISEAHNSQPGHVLRRLGNEFSQELYVCMVSDEYSAGDTSECKFIV